MIPRSMHGLREGHGTIKAAIEMQTYLHGERAKGNIFFICFLDLSAGFDAVPDLYLLRILQLKLQVSEKIFYSQTRAAKGARRAKIETRLPRPVI